MRRARSAITHINKVSARLDIILQLVSPICTNTHAQSFVPRARGSSSGSHSTEDLNPSEATNDSTRRSITQIKFVRALALGQKRTEEEGGEEAKKKGKPCVHILDYTRAREKIGRIYARGAYIAIARWASLISLSAVRARTAHTVPATVFLYIPRTRASVIKMVAPAARGAADAETNCHLYRLIYPRIERTFRATGNRVDGSRKLCVNLCEVERSRSGD